MDDCAALEETLNMAKTVLADLEKKAASYTFSSLPSTLKIDLEQKRKEVEDLETRLKTAQLAKKQNLQIDLTESDRPSLMRSPVSDEQYIERTQAKRLLESFANALKEPEKQPLLFNIYGIGGVAKTTTN